MGGGAPSKGQFDALNIKLDKIISLLSGGKISEAPKAKVVEVKEKKEVVKKAKAKKGKKSKIIKQKTRLIGWFFVFDYAVFWE